MALSVDRLTAEHLVDPLGLDVLRPRLSWRTRDDAQGTRQVAYRVTTADWDSGRLEGTGSADVLYRGPISDAVRWRVQVWTADGRTVTSDEAVFEQGLTQWSGHWICRPIPTDARDGHRPAAHLRTAFDLPGEVEQARLHVTAGGLCEPWLNGHRVGRDRLAPGWTDYRHRVRSRTFDVTSGLVVGRNALGVVVMDGWYAGYVGWDHQREHYGRTPVAKLELVVDLADGTQVRIRSDETWKGRHGAIRSGDLLGGEHYDARLELPGWAEADYDDTDWEAAWPDPGPTGDIVATPCEPVLVLGEVHPVSVQPTLPGSRIMDLGEEVVGWPRLTVDAEPGTIVRLRCAEALDDDGQLWTANLRGAACTDTYVVGPGGRQMWEPRSTYRSFRYVEVTGPASAQVTGVVAHTAARETGAFSCSSTDLTELWDVARRTIRNNLVALPTDCPQRDERLGWLADAEVTVELASYLFDLGGFYAGWLADVRSGQSAAGAFPDVAPRLAHTDDGAPGWGDAGVAIPWALWQWYGDRTALTDNVEAMARWPQWIARANPDGVWREGRNRDYGDWLATVETPKQLLATAWWARSCALVATAAGVLDREDLRGPALSLLAQVRAGFSAEWERASERGELTQTALLLATAFDLVPAEQTGPLLVADVEANGLTTGFQGVRHLLPQLTRAGRSDLAYALALSETQPGWLPMLRQGATTIWERWDSRTPEGFADPFLNSLCHAALGTVATWLHATVGGLARDPSVVGWRRALVAPELGGGLTWAHTSYDSRSGRYAVAWRLLADDVLEVDIEIPVGGEAGVRLPGAVLHPVEGLRTYAGRTTGTLPSGAWTLQVRQEIAAPSRSQRA